MSATKAQADTMLRMSEVIAQEAGSTHPVIVLSVRASRRKSLASCRPRFLRHRRTRRRDRSLQHEFRGLTSAYAEATTWRASSWRGDEEHHRIAAGVVEARLGHSASRR